MTLKEARTQSGMTQRELSAGLAKVGIRTDPGMLSRYESGVCYPTLETINALEHVLQVDDLVFPGMDALTLAVQDEVTRGEISPLAERVLACMPTGKANAKSRERMVYETGLPDRTMRKGVEELRLHGYMIINNQSGSGYYISDELTDLVRQYRQETARAASLLTSCKAIRQRLKELGQPV